MERQCKCRDVECETDIQICAALRTISAPNRDGADGRAPVILRRVRAFHPHPRARPSRRPPACPTLRWLYSRSRCCCRSGTREGGLLRQQQQRPRLHSATTAYHERAGGRACTVLLRNIERVHFAPAEGGARTGPTTSLYADSVTAKVREAQQTALMASGRVGPG